MISPDGVRPVGWSVCLPLLIFPCTIKSRSSLLTPAHPGGLRKGAVKRVVCVCARAPFLWSNFLLPDPKNDLVQCMHCITSMCWMYSG